MRPKVLLGIVVLFSVGTAYAASEQGMSSQGAGGQKQDQGSFSNVGPRSGMPSPHSGDPQIAGEQSGFPSPDFPKVEGKLLTIESDYYTIQDSDGYLTRLRVDNKTKKEGNLQLGDNVTAYRTIGGYAKWIRAADANSQNKEQGKDQAASRAGRGTKAHEDVMNSHSQGQAHQPDAMQSGGSRASQFNVTGEVLRIEGGDYVVKDNEGREVRLHRESDTKVYSPVNTGDKLQAEVGWDGTMISINKAENSKANAPSGQR